MGFFNNKTGRYQLYTDAERKAYGERMWLQRRKEYMAEWITVWRLKEDRNWTDAAIRKYLGEPQQQNGYKVFKVSQVKKAEQNEEFRAWMRKRIDKLFAADQKQYTDEYAAQLRDKRLAALGDERE